MPDVDKAEMIAQKIFENKNLYYRVAISFCKNKDDSLDAISDMTLIILKKYKSLMNPDAFVGWSTKILINICKRKSLQNKRLTYLEDLDYEIADFDNYHESLVDLDKALASINSRFSEVIIFKDIFGYTFKKIASIVNVPLRTAQSRYNLGIKELRKRLGDSYNEEI